MQVKLTISIILYLNLTVLVRCYTQPKDSFHTIALWRSRLLHEDAMKKRYQDTLIDSLESKIRIWEKYHLQTTETWNQRIKLLDERYESELELQKIYQKQLKLQIRQHKRQRDLLILVSSIQLLYIVFKPP